MQLRQRGSPEKGVPAEHGAAMNEEAAKRGGFQETRSGSSGLSGITNGDGDLCPSHSDARGRHGPYGRAHVHGREQE